MTGKRFQWCGRIDREYVDEFVVDTFANKELDEEDMCDLLNKLVEENEELKQSVNNLKETIIKITIAFQRKHDSTIVDLVDEIHEEDISDLIKELME